MLKVILSHGVFQGSLSSALKGCELPRVEFSASLSENQYIARLWLLKSWMLSCTMCYSQSVLPTEIFS